MKIAVCLKQVPGTASVKMDPETKRLLRESAAAVVNPFDYYALEEALRLKERHPGVEVVVISMGPPKAAESLREALAFGADKAVLLSDRRFAGSDTWATSYALALAIRKIGGVGLVLCGRQAVDGDTAQVPPGIAAHLSWSQAACAASVELSGETLKVRRMASSGYELCELRLPGVISTVKELNEPRVPRLSGWLKAGAAEVEVWDAAALEADPALLGLNGSPTRVVKTFAPPSRKGSTRLVEGSPESAARAIFEELRIVAKL